jgi:hypothetical protein
MLVKRVSLLLNAAFALTVLDVMYILHNLLSGCKNNLETALRLHLSQLIFHITCVNFHSWTIYSDAGRVALTVEHCC